MQNHTHSSLIHRLPRLTDERRSGTVACPSVKCPFHSNRTLFNNDRQGRLTLGPTI